MTQPTDFCIIYVTTPDVDMARRLAQSIVSRRLAACANIIPQMESLYWWEGKMEIGNECVLIFKTRRSLTSALTDAVKAEHTYKCPCVVELPIAGGSSDFLAWIDAETTPLAG